MDVLDKGLDALSGKINYDKEKMEFVKIETGNEKWNKPSYNNENGKFTLLINSETITEKNEAIVSTFKVKRKCNWRCNYFYSGFSWCYIRRQKK